MFIDEGFNIELISFKAPLILGVISIKICKTTLFM
jgi:hypothetical protein